MSLLSRRSAPARPGYDRSPCMACEELGHRRVDCPNDYLNAQEGLPSHRNNRNTGPCPCRNLPAEATSQFGGSRRGSLFPDESASRAGGSILAELLGRQSTRRSPRDQLLEELRENFPYASEPALAQRADALLASRRERDESTMDTALGLTPPASATYPAPATGPGTLGPLSAPPGLVTHQPALPPPPAMTGAAAPAATRRQAFEGRPLGDQAVHAGATGAAGAGGTNIALTFAFLASLVAPALGSPPARIWLGHIDVHYRPTGSRTNATTAFRYHAIVLPEPAPARAATRVQEVAQSIANTDDLAGASDRDAVLQFPVGTEVTATRAFNLRHWIEVSGTQGGAITLANVSFSVGIIVDY